MYHGLPALHGLLIWWFSTGLILFLDGLPKRTFRWSMAAATVLLIACTLRFVCKRGRYQRVRCLHRVHLRCR